MAAGLGFKTFVTGEVLTASDTNGYLMQGVNVFANAAARTAAITSPQEGQMSYLKDTDSTEYYTGSAWTSITSGAGSMTLISTTTLSGASTTLSSIPTTYKSLYLTLYGMTNATGNGALRINPNNGATGNFWGTKITSVTSLAVADGWLGYGATAAVRTNADNAITMEITNTTNVLTAMRPVTLWGSYYDGGAHLGMYNFGSIYQVGGTAITSLVISNTGGNWSTGTALLYGVN